MLLLLWPGDLELHMLAAALDANGPRPGPLCLPADDSEVNRPRQVRSRCLQWVCTLGHVG